MLTLSAAAVHRLLPIRECIEVMADSFRALARDRVVQPLRTTLRVPDGSGALFLMPAWVGEPAALGVKILTVYPDNPSLGLEALQGVVLFFEPEKGTPLAAIDAAAVTGIRTAAVSALATRLLAREDAADLAIVGSGVQARTHLESMLAVRRIRRVRAWSRDRARLERFCSEMMERHGTLVEPAGSAQAAVEGADVVCTVTASPEPVLLGEWLRPGAHVNAVGAHTPTTRELDTTAVLRARLFVDRREAALAEAGEILIPIAEAAIGEDHIAGQLGDVLIGKAVGRRTPDEITVFKSLGLAIEDVAAALYLYRRAGGKA